MKKEMTSFIKILKEVGTFDVDNGKIEKINMGDDNKFDSLIGLYFEYEEIKNKIAELNIKDDYAKKLIEI